MKVPRWLRWRTDRNLNEGTRPDRGRLGADFLSMVALSYSCPCLSKADL
jgi:hypothetical protein